MSMSNRKKRLTRNSIIGGAVAVVACLALTGIPGSGAYFSASGNGHATSQTATLTLDLGSPTDGYTGTFNLKFNNLAPGGYVDQVFWVKNTGSVAANVSLTDRTTSNTAGAALTGADWEYFRTGVVGYTAQVKSNVGLNANLGVLQPGQSKAFTLRKSLEADAGNNWQGVTVGSNVVVTLDQVH